MDDEGAEGAGLPQGEAPDSLADLAVQVAAQETRLGRVEKLQAAALAGEDHMAALKASIAVAEAEHAANIAAVLQGATDAMAAAAPPTVPYGGNSLPPDRAGTYPATVAVAIAPTPGRRLDPPVKLDDFTPGAYGKVGEGWLVCLPTGELCSLNAGHTITEHEDGTITVSPSILMPADRGIYYHGYLEHGIWREV